LVFSLEIALRVPEIAASFMVLPQTLEAWKGKIFEGRI
jgi:hypothetical protein